MMRPAIHPTRLRALLVAAATAAALGVIPAAAEAASVSATAGTIAYTAAPGEVNHVILTPWGLSVLVSDTGVKLAAGSGCHSLSNSTAACVGTRLTADAGDRDDSFAADARLLLDMSVSGGPGNDHLVTGGGSDTLDGGAGSDTLSGGPGTDTVTYADATGPVTAATGGGADNGTLGEQDSIAADVENLTGGDAGDHLTGDGGPNVLSGGAGDDSLDGGAGSDSLDGGAGDDTLEARDGEADTIACGTGQDQGEADSADAVSSDCEAVLVPVAPLPPAGPPADPTAAPNSQPPGIPAQGVAVSAAGVASVRIVCPAGSGGCSGTVALELPLAARAGHASHGKVAVGARRRRAMKLGQTKFTAKAGTSPIVRVRLSKRGRQRILRHRRSHGRVRIATRSADGKTVVTTRGVTILARREAPRRTGRK